MGYLIFAIGFLVGAICCSVGLAIYGIKSGETIKKKKDFKLEKLDEKLEKNT